MNRPGLLLTLALTPLVAGQAAAQTPVTLTITEWEVPWADTRPRDPYVAPDGRIWFGTDAGTIGRAVVPR